MTPQAPTSLLLVLLSAVAAAGPGGDSFLTPQDRETLAICRQRPPAVRRYDVFSLVEWRSHRGQPYPWLAGGARLPEGVVALTFDDGPMRGITPRIRAQLDRCGVPAHFFVLGRLLEGRFGAGQAEAAVAGGHVVGTHGYAHKGFVRQLRTRRSRGRELELGVGRLVEATGRWPALARLPFGQGLRDPATLALLWGDGRELVHVSWNLASGDSTDADERAPGRQPRSAGAIVARVVQTLERSRRPGERLGHGIVPLHDTSRRTADAIPMLLAWLVANGYSFAVLDREGGARLPELEVGRDGRLPVAWQP